MRAGEKKGGEQGIHAAAGWALALRAVGTGCNLLFSFLLARRVGVEGAGVYYLVLAAGNVASTVGRCGLENVLLRQLVALTGRDPRADVRDLLRRGGAAVFTGSVVMAGVLYLGASALTAILDEQGDFLIATRWMALAVVPLSFVFVSAECLRGLDRLRASILVQEVAVPFVGCIAVLSFSRAHGPVIVVWAFTIAVSVSALVGVALCLGEARKTRVRVDGTPGLRRVLGAGFPLMVAGLVTFLPQWTAIYLIGATLGREEVGRLGMSVRLAALVSFALIAANVAGKRHFAALHARRDMPGLRRAALSTSLFALLAALPVGLTLVILPGTVLGWAGPDFVAAAPVLVLLVVGQLFIVATGSVGALLMMTGHEQALRNSVVLSALVAIVAMVCLVPAMGTTGAAVGLATGWAVQKVLSTLYVRRYLGFFLWWSPRAPGT